MGPLAMSSPGEDVGMLSPKTHQVLPEAASPIPAPWCWVDAPQHLFSQDFLGSKASTCRFPQGMQGRVAKTMELPTISGQKSVFFR